MMNRLLRTIKNPELYFHYFVLNISRHFPHLLPDKYIVKALFYTELRQKLNLKDPKTFNEKLQWLKLYDRRPKYTSMVDKYLVKEFVARIIGEEYIIPTLGVWNSFDEIPFDELPERFVLKTTHDSGTVIICKDKNNFDKEAACRIISKSLSENFYFKGREWPYKNVEPRIIAEQYLEDEEGELKDYKIFTFNGKPEIIEIDYDRFKEHHRNLYTTKWEQIEAQIIYPSDPSRQFAKPEVLDKLLMLSEKLSAGIPHVRTDFYILGNKIYFGELTFFHECGLSKITPPSFDRYMGDLIELPQKFGNV